MLEMISRMRLEVAGMVGDGGRPGPLEVGEGGGSKRMWWMRRRIRGSIWEGESWTHWFWTQR